ncbi:hypothetical protein [Acaryochloris marina]|uniref:Uncharacterized protein n=1 Tax=Acaryochloris marina (strain MBIC 11017) TaxID=329726 RepID=B0C4U8_ACAM1|nr:hypothetical protein [Acaryochloris marina]ABW31086.1 hypothetical protein AM1_6154 [Acaryochloris marina MBIC11017]BDM79798.1 hypothetical protein AM10699_26660 [Acaryochloris marina MBIC10699]
MSNRKTLNLNFSTRPTTRLAATIDTMNELYGTDIEAATANLLEYMMAPMTAALSGASRSEVDALIEKSLARARLHLESARLHLPCDELPEKVAEPFAAQEASCLSSPQEDSSPPDEDEEFDYSKPIGVFDDDY